MKLLSFLLYLSLLFVEKAYADFATTDMERFQLPVYCTARSHPGTPDFKHWDKKMGSENFIHIHHYCSGLNGLNKAYFLKEPHKSRMLEGALGGIDYVLSRASKHFYLLPEMHLKKGEIYQLLNTNQKAIEEYNIAIASNPKYSPPYYNLAKIYMEQGNKEKAVDILTKGLEVNPTSKLLSKKLAKIKSSK